jgi:dihydrofolate reductase
VRYGVAVSLDGFIAGPRGEYDWIVGDPSIDFAAIYRQFDTAVMGRKTYEMMLAQGGDGSIPGLDVVVFSRTLSPQSKRGVRVTSDDPAKVVSELKAQPGRDIWLFGGGDLCRSLLDAGLVDVVDVALNPVLLTAGVPFVAPGALSTLTLSDHRVLPRSGIVLLSYALPGAVGPAPRIGYVKSPGAAKRARAKRPAKSAARGKGKRGVSKSARR